MVTASGPIATYSVPTTASLVINTVDITPAIDSAGLSFTLHLAGSTNAMNWEIPGSLNLAQFETVHFSYPSGIVIGPGLNPGVQMEPNGSGKNDIFVDLFGYLTNN